MPAPDENSTGKETTKYYDANGRLQIETIVNTGAYRRYEYSANGIQLKVFSTIVDTDNDGADADDEVLSESWTDGAGRVRRSRTEHPNSIGGWKGNLVEYDVLGQVKRATVPTEISVSNPNNPESWTPAGADSRVDGNNQPIWLWTQQEYDWKGRVTRTIPSDSNGSDGKDQLISYAGCGCAGGQVTQIQAEVVPRDDQPATSARRTNRVYEDILGRNFKTEILDWDGNVHKTLLNIYNGRDQIVSTREIAGAETGNNYKETLITYDGHGRLKTQHRPEQDLNAAVSYTYFADDKTQSFTDGRGAVKQYQYNDLGLVQQISYQSPSQVPIVYTEPTMTDSSVNVDGSIYKVLFKGLNIDANAELSIDIPVNNQTQNLRFSNLERSTENGEQVLVFDISSDAYLSNWVQTHLGYLMNVSIVNPNTNKKTAQVSFIGFLGGNNGLEPRVIFAPPMRNYSVSETPTVMFGYDRLGNRTSMSDGSGSITYEYNNLSQMTSETRQFNETVPLAPQANNSFRFEYTYGLTGQLKTYKQPFGEIVAYKSDKAGRLTAISGNRTVGNVQFDYITEAKYRAWGAVSEIDYGNNTSAALIYNNRLQVQQYNLNASAANVSTIQKQYDYYDDGSLKASSPNFSSTSIFDRSYEYDHLGRLKKAKTGAEARGQTENNPINRPYRMVLDYNQFDDITNQQRLHWTSSFNTTYQYQNNRVLSESETSVILGWENRTSSTNHASFDAEGQSIDETQFNADGKISQAKLSDREYDPSGHGDFRIEWDTIDIKYSGDGYKVKTIKNGVERAQGSSSNIQRKDYFIRSSVINDVIVEIKSYQAGTILAHAPRLDISIYAHGTEIARRGVRNIESTSTFTDKTIIKSTDPSGADITVNVLRSDSTSPMQESFGESVTRDPFGGYVGYSNVYPPEQPGTGWPDPNDPNCHWNDYDDFDCNFPDEYDEPESEENQAGSIPENRCIVNGFEGDCDDVIRHPQLYEIDRGDHSISYDENGNPDIKLNVPCHISDELCRIGEEARQESIDDELENMLRELAGPGWGPDADDGLFERVLQPFLDQIDREASCARRLSAIFGNGTSVAATLFNAPLLDRRGYIAAPTYRVDSESPANGVIHLYASSNGTGREETNVFAPAGFTWGNQYAQPNLKSAGEFQNAVIINYAAGKLSKYGFDGPLRINFTHIGPTDSSGNYLRQSGQPNANGSLPIGVAGNYTRDGNGVKVGGSEEGAFGTGTHTHMIFESNGKRIDPRDVFCSDISTRWFDFSITDSGPPVRWRYR